MRQTDHVTIFVFLLVLFINFVTLSCLSSLKQKAYQVSTGLSACVSSCTSAITLPAIIYILLSIYFVPCHYGNVAFSFWFIIGIIKCHEVNYTFWYIYKTFAPPYGEKREVVQTIIQGSKRKGKAKIIFVTFLRNNENCYDKCSTISIEIKSKI